MRRHLAHVALIVASLSMLFSAVLFKLNYDQGNDIRDALDEIQQSRIALSRESCRQRNQERAVTRSNLRENLRNLAQVPDEALEQLGFTRAEAVAQVERQLKQVAPLDCKKLVRRVATSNEKASLEGGGAQALVAPRQPRRSEVEKGETGPSDPPGSESPGETVTDPDEPAPDGGDSPGDSPGSGDGDPGGGGGGTVTEEVPPTEEPSGGPIVDVPKILDDVIDTVCQIATPLGPLVTTCP